MPLAADDEPTYCGAWADGAYVAGARISDWHDAHSQPKLNGRPMLDPAQPLRWATQEGVDPPSPPDAYVEFFGGDRLPGRVIGYRDAGEAPSRRWPPHLIVEPAAPVDAPTLATRDRLPVDAASVRRVVWRRRPADRYQPGTAFAVDGRQIHFRAARWTADGVQLLLADGRATFVLSELAEIHLPRRSDYEHYVDALALLTPLSRSLLVRVETLDGGRLTTSLERHHVRSAGAAPHAWWQMVQPVWSLAPIWIQHVAVYRRQMFAPHEPPLTLFEPSRAIERPIIGRGWPWRLDQNIFGQPLRSGGRQFGWGLGVHAGCDLEFDLPMLAAGFESSLGLDQSVGHGGCVRAHVLLGADRTAARYASETLVGADRAFATGRIEVEHGPDHPRTLTLSVDALVDDPPPGADPLDIRDTFNWLEPRLLLDRERLAADVARRLPRVWPAWRDWEPTAAAAPGASLAVAGMSTPWSAEHRFDAESREFRLVVRPTQGAFTLRRRLAPSPGERQLLICVQSPDDASGSRIAVAVNGLRVTELDVPTAQPLVAPPPLALSLAALGDGELTVDVIQSSDDQRGFVEWRALEIGPPPPGVRWTPLAVAEMASARGGKFRRLDDQSLVLESPPAEFDTYEATATIEAPHATALRIEALPDAALPSMGPGAASDGNFVLGEVRATTRSSGQVGPTESPIEIEWSAATADFSQQNLPAAQLIDGNGKNGWAIGPRSGTAHAAVLTTREGAELPLGAELRVLLVQETFPRHLLGRFRLSVTDAPRTLALDPPPQTLPRYPPRALVLFDDQAGFLQQTQGGQAALDANEKFSGRLSLRLVAPGQRTAARLPGLEARIVEQPRPGEFRFLRFAWKKIGGRSICLQLAHGGQWGPTDGRPASFRYHAGPGPDCFGASLKVADEAPAEWTLVTRDLFADFGEHTLTGLDLTVPDGACGYLDRVLLAPREEDFDGWSAGN